jgi:hypothetical protein
MTLRITLDSNVWERISQSIDPESRAIRNAFVEKRAEGLICESAFRIESIPRSQRAAYFSRPLSSIHTPGDVVLINGQPHIRIISFGPDDSLHPGLPMIQAERLLLAVDAGLRVMRGMAWLGLPCPQEALDPSSFVEETAVQRNEREQRQIAVNTAIWDRGVGKAVFDEIGGWQGFHSGTCSEKRIARACAEWADGELVAAHVAYGNDILCTEDRGVGSGRSIPAYPVVTHTH